MPAREAPVHPGELAGQLARMRKISGLTGDELAERLDWTRSKVPKLENERQMPSAEDIRGWAEATGHAGEVPELLALLGDTEAVRRQQRHRKSGRLLKNAARIRSFQVTIVPALLQTPGYARCRAVESARLKGTGEDRVEEAVSAAARRQEVLYDTGKTFEFVLTEAVLRYLLCPPEVMRGQLNRLLGLPGLATVRFGIIPFGRQLAVAPEQGFWLADDIAVTGAYGSARALTRTESIRYGKIMDSLAADAVTGDDACQLILAALAALGGDR